MTSRRSLLRVESTPSKDVYVFFILRRRVQRCCTAVRGVKNKKCIHRRHKILCVHNKIYLSETVQNICGRPHRGVPTTLSQFCVNCKNIPYNPKQRTQSLCPIGHIFRIGKIYNTARHISQLVQHGLEIGYLVL